MGWRGWLLVMVSGLLAGTAGAQSGSVVRVTAEATPAEVGTAGRITYTIRVEGAPRSTIRTPEPPATTNLVLQEATPVTQQNLSFDEGEMQRSVTFRWRYEPMRTGTARIRGTTVTVRGASYTTDEIRIEVVPQAQRPDAAPRGHAGAPSPSPDPEDDRTDAGPLRPRALFIEASATSDRVYQNEQVGVAYRLFFRPGVRLRRSRLADAWDATGFWREELDVASRPTPRTRQKYGRSYQTVALKRVALFPTRPGTLRVDPLRIETEVQGLRRHGDGGPVRSAFEPLTLASRALKIAVEPLPEGAPPAFDGAVGQFDVRGAVEADSVAVGDAVRLSVQVQGSGNLTTIGPPQRPSLPAFEVYDPTVEMEVDRQGRALKGLKTFTYTLVPRSPGTHEIPPFTFAYFDPEAGQYVTRRTAARTLRVTGSATMASAGRTGAGFPVNDVAGLMDAPDTWHRTDPVPLYRWPWAYVALLLPLGAAGAGWLYRRGGTTGTEEPTPGDEPEADDMTEVQRHLEAAQQHLHNEDVRAFYRAVEQALLAASTTNEKTKALLDTCRTAPFAPDDPTPADMQAVLDAARDHLRAPDPQSSA